MKVSLKVSIPLGRRKTVYPEALSVLADLGEVAGREAEREAAFRGGNPRVGGWGFILGVGDSDLAVSEAPGATV